MATLTVRGLPDDVRDKLRVQAAQNGRSMEAEVRAVLSGAVASHVAERAANTSARVERSQAAFAPYRPKTESGVAELLVDRREEVRRGDEKWSRLEREDGGNGAPSAHETQADKLKRARAIVRRYVPEGRNLVDEFLAERRAMWGED